jgi:hypothetical protein
MATKWCLNGAIEKKNAAACGTAKPPQPSALQAGFKHTGKRCDMPYAMSHEP